MGIEAAVELSGHKSEPHIWRYIQASEDDMDEASKSRRFVGPLPPNASC